jgi:putative MATE family efflux protein
MEAKKSKFDQMTTEPVEKLVAKLAVPTIIGMLITAFYNMADTYFVGQVGTSATAAVGISFSLMAIIQAIGFFFGHGSGNYISRKLGAKQEGEAEAMASTGFFSSLIVGIVIGVFGLIFIEPIARVLGSTETILPYAVEYLRYIFIAAPFMIGCFVLNNQIKFQGSAVYAVLGLGTGAILNIALDPLLIFVFDMGVSGAALATAISQLVSFIILVYMDRKKTVVPVTIKQFRPALVTYKEMVRGGFPSLARQGLASVSTIMLNTMAGAYGADAAIAGMSIVTRICMFSSSAVIGFGQGFQPVCGFNYGAKLFDRVKKAYWFCVKFATVFLIIVGAAMFIFAPDIISWFRKDDPQVIAIGSFALRCQCVTLFLTGIIVMSNMMLQTIGKAIPATIVAMSRQFIFLIPALLILGPCFGLLGVEISQAVADVCAFILTVPLTIWVMKEMKTDN